MKPKWGVQTKLSNKHNVNSVQRGPQNKSALAARHIVEALAGAVLPCLEAMKQIQSAADVQNLTEDKCSNSLTKQIN